MAQGRPGNPNWVKGVSGNPGGRPRAALDVQELARAHTPEAIRALVAALDSPRERVNAACALLDRGWGRPALPIAADRDQPLIVDFRWSDAPPQPAPELTPISDSSSDTDAADEACVVWGSVC